MGFDCTLHLIDESAIRDEFVPGLLGKEVDIPGLPRETQDEFWRIARKSLHCESPDLAASWICQSAIAFNACSLPYHCERNFSLCLWLDEDDDWAYPEQFAFSPASLFTEVTAEFPELWGCFPRWFEENFSSGVYIPSARVPEVRSWIERQTATLPADHRLRFKGLLKVLHAAEANQLAYWEATDLSLLTNNKFPGDPERIPESFARYLSQTQHSELEQSGIEEPLCTLFVTLVDDCLVSPTTELKETQFWDLSVWPPRKIRSISGFAVGHAGSRDGQWLVFRHPDDEDRTFRPYVAPTLESPFAALVDPQCDVRAGGFYQGRPVVFPHLTGAAEGKPLTPLWLSEDGSGWEPMPGIPPVEPNDDGSIERPVAALVSLAKGDALVVWDGDGYELCDGRFEKTFPLEAKSSCFDWTSVPTSQDGFFYLSDRCLREAHRHGTPTAHAPELTNIVRLGPGPAGSIILHLGENDEGDVARLYFPSDGTYIRIRPELFDDTEYDLIYWNASVDRLVVLGERFLAMPTEAVLRRAESREQRAESREQRDES